MDGGTGVNTLITPVPLAQLRALGVTVSNFQNIVVQANSCKSECVTQPDCSGHGACAEGATSGQVQCKCDLPYQGATCNIKGCVSQDDTDHDLVLDCLDGCPYDPAKTQPGVCGCGVPETDTDGDGTPDCVEQCPNDPNNTTSGECGCVGEPTLKPAGTPCNDTACPVAAGALATCNGAGVCGDRSSCVPGAGCRFLDWQGTAYWVCGTDPGAGGSAPVGQLPEAAAAAACDAKGLALVRIDSPEQNTFLARLFKAPIWLGANDISVSNSWRWSTAKTKDGDPFWSGGATGTPVAGRFAFWNPGAPGTNRCATMRPGDGRWIDSSCTEVHGYLCSFPAPLAQATGPGGKPIGNPPPGMLAQPPAITNCVPEANSGLPTTFGELRAEFDASATNPVGAAANPPTSGTCPPEDPATAALGSDNKLADGCQPTEISKLNCFTDDECVAKAGAGFVCRQLKDQLDCPPPDAGTSAANAPSTADCRGHARCMTVVCPTDLPPCDQINICNPGSEVDAGLDPGAQLDAGAFNPSGLFQGTLPDAAPTGQYIDLPTGTGTGHSWCKMTPENPVPSASQAPGNYTGHSGGSSAISFKFDPDLVFDVNASPAALGETEHVIHAQARLGASVHLNNFLGQSFTGDILDASVGMQVNRCSIDDTTETTFMVLGLDRISPDQLGIPMINSDDIGSCQDPNSALCALYHASSDCETQLNLYEGYANRAKKAFRDAQQLLSQYYAARLNGHSLAANLCHQIGVDSANVPGFPGGNVCPANEPVEATINRFVDYYQSTGNGQLSLFRQAAGNLTTASLAFAEKFSLSGPNRLSLQFADTHGEESQTILNVPFAIGPVPMVLQVDVFAQYGVSGSFALDVEPPIGLDGPANVEQTLAKVDANVVPYASAGLSAFVGAGIDIGPIAATIGLEGAVTLADLKAPIFAGAGVKVAVNQDVRPLPDEVKPPVSTALNAFAFGGGPKSFKYSVFYEYGAGVDLDNILSGALNGRLRIRFAFFSRTWRKQIVKFDGWSQHFDLVHGGSDPSVATASQTVPTSVDTSRNTTQVAAGQNAMGVSEPELPLMQLASLPVPTGMPAADAGTPVDFDASAVQSVFYDRQCCIAPGGTCFGALICCPGSTCQIPPPVPDAGLQIAIGTCSTLCQAVNQACKSDTDCCNNPPSATINRCSDSTKLCEACSATNGPCADDHDCCEGVCGGGVCQPSPR